MAHSCNGHAVPPVASLMEEIPMILAAFGFFGAIFVCPLVFMLMRHQRAMAELMHRGTADDAARRIEMLEHEVRQLKAAGHDQILRQDDSPELRRRITE